MYSASCAVTNVVFKYAVNIKELLFFKVTVMGVLITYTYFKSKHIIFTFCVIFVLLFT